MSIATRDIVPFTHARANLSDLAHDTTVASETSITKNMAHDEMLAAFLGPVSCTMRPTRMYAISADPKDLS